MNNCIENEDVYSLNDGILVVGIDSDEQKEFLLNHLRDLEILDTEYYPATIMTINTNIPQASIFLKNKVYMAGNVVVENSPKDFPNSFLVFGLFISMKDDSYTHINKLAIEEIVKSGLDSLKKYIKLDNCIYKKCIYKKSNHSYILEIIEEENE